MEARLNCPACQGRKWLCPMCDHVALAAYAEEIYRAQNRALPDGTVSST